MLALALAALALAAPTRDDIAARAKELKLPHADRIAADALPGARLVAGGPDPVGGNRLGGEPDLPAKMKWPRCRGQKLSFLGQFRLADLPAGALPSTGVVTVFANLDPDGEGVAPIDEANGRVGEQTCVIVRRLRSPLARRAAPKGVRSLRSRPMTLRPTLTVPDIYVAEQRYGFEDRDNAWWKLEDEAMVGRLRVKTPYAPNHQLLGWPWPIQDTPLRGCGRRPAERLTHRLFLQVDADDALGFEFGDAGVLYLSGTPADLRAGRFNRLCAELQSS